MKGEVYVLKDPVSHKPCILLNSKNSELIVGFGKGSVLPTMEVRFYGEEAERSIRAAVRRSPRYILESDVFVCVVGGSAHLSVNLKIPNPTRFLIKVFLKSEGLGNVLLGDGEIGAMFVAVEGGFLMSDLKNLFFDKCESVGELRLNLTAEVKRGGIKEVKALWGATLNSVSYFLGKWSSTG